MSDDPVERGLEIEQAQLRGFARSVAEIEWLLLVLVVLYLFIANPALARSAPVLGVLAGFTGFVLLFRYGKPLAKHTQVKLLIEVFAMLAFLTAVLVAAGGVGSPLLNLYLVPIVAAALALGKRAVTLVFVLVCCCYPLIGVLTGGTDALTADFAIAGVGALAPFLLVAFSTALLVENINVAKGRIRALSDRDELTGLHNLRAFTRLAENQHEVVSRMEGRYAILMVDIEHLKTVNDTYGHEAGSRAVKLVADALVRLTRSTDIVARYGGDEFIVLLGGVDKELADEVAQRIRNVVYSTTLEVDVKMVRIKVNVGAAAFPENGANLKALLTMADRLMVKDKELRDTPKGKLTVQKR
jgi:diguanylate cyclase (GGDEF)-like protein